MSYPRRYIPIFSFLTVAVFFLLLKPFLPTPRLVWDPPLGPAAISDPSVQPQSTEWKHQEGKMSGGETIPEAEELAQMEAIRAERVAKEEKDQQANLRPAAGMHFQPGIPKAIGDPYTKALIVPRTKEEDINWIEENFGGNADFRAYVYTVDDFDSVYHPPKNKGHEVMVYLSYIIENYENLSDINMFMHSHRHAWHNNQLMDGDAVQMISRLSAERVTREGFMNMRCHWEPGCPAWMHPLTKVESENKQEESLLAKSWSEIFPLDEVPEILAQPCCAQFAISKERIQSLPLARYVFYRDWLLRTSLSDYLSGRVWEYVWQFVFTGKNILCPKEHVCYCDGFGVCFGSEENYKRYWERHDERSRLEGDLRNWNEQKTKWEATPKENRVTAEDLKEPEADKNLELQGRISALTAWCDKKGREAKERGDVAMNRAKEVGRHWVDGDGF